MSAANDCQLAKKIDELGADYLYSDFNCDNYYAPGNFEYVHDKSLLDIFKDDFHISFPFMSYPTVTSFHFVIGLIVGYGTVEFLREGVTYLAEA